MDNGKDATIGLLKEGLAKLRGDKIYAKNADDYIDAE